MVIHHHKSGNGYKKIKPLDTPVRTVRAVIKRHRTCGIVENLAGRGRGCTASPGTVREMVRVRVRVRVRP